MPIEAHIARLPAGGKGRRQVTTRGEEGSRCGAWRCPGASFRAPGTRATPPIGPALRAVGAGPFRPLLRPEDSDERER